VFEPSVIVVTVRRLPVYERLFEYCVEFRVYFSVAVEVPVGAKVVPSEFRRSR